MRMFMIPAVAVVLLLAGCGSSGPPSAHSLAAKISGCSGITPGTPAVMEVQDVTCNLPDGAPVEIGTFANSSAEQHWISDGGSPMSPDPMFGGCCVQGSGWAATVGWGNNGVGGGAADFPKVISALGGRQVDG